MQRSDEGRHSVEELGRGSNLHSRKGCWLLQLGIPLAFPCIKRYSASRDRCYAHYQRVCWPASCAFVGFIWAQQIDWRPRLIVVVEPSVEVPRGNRFCGQFLRRVFASYSSKVKSSQNLRVLRTNPAACLAMSKQTGRRRIGAFQATYMSRKS
jgi:hypothetical protein